MPFDDVHIAVTDNSVTAGASQIRTTDIVDINQLIAITIAVVCDRAICKINNNAGCRFRIIRNIIARAAVKCIVADITDQNIVVRTTINCVVTKPTIERIIISATKDCVVIISAVNRVITGITAQCILPGKARDIIITSAALKNVCRQITDQRVSILCRNHALDINHSVCAVARG